MEESGETEMTEHYYAEFLYPGIIVSETSLKEITREQYLNPKTITVPKGSFGFRVMHRNEVIEEGDVLLGSYKNTSGWFYKGKKLSKADVAKEYGSDSTLYHNMENNGYEFVVKSEYGQAFPLHEKDTILALAVEANGRKRV
jgi:hypothetical protein